MIEAGAWANLSVEIDQKEVRGKQYPQLLRAVALLGETPAAIGGLNDFAKLYAGQPDCPARVIFMAAGEPGTPEDFPGDDPSPQPPEGGSTPDGDETMELKLTKEMLVGLGLPEDATAEQVEARMQELATKASETPDEGDPPSPDDPEPADPEPSEPDPATTPTFDVAAAVTALDGLRTALTGEATPAPAPAPVQMSEGEVGALKRIAELESQVANREAERRVDSDLSDNDQGVIPPSVRKRLRPHLVKMAAAGEDDGYTAVLGGISRVKLSERGTAKTSPLSQIEVSDEERKICRDNGMELDEFRQAKAERVGIKIQES